MNTETYESLTPGQVKMLQDLGAVEIDESVPDGQVRVAVPEGTGYLTPAELERRIQAERERLRRRVSMQLDSRRR